MNKDDLMRIGMSRRDVLANAETEDAASIIARHILRTSYSDIPLEVVQAVKNSILDTLGVCLAASTMGTGCKELADLVKERGGRDESTIIGFGGRVPAWMAAFVNGALAHSLDYDDLHYSSVSHPSGPIIPAAFAIAECVGQVSGKEFITAIALGHDMEIRLMLSLPSVEFAFAKWLPFPIFGVLTAAAICSKLLSLSEDKISHAIGIALCYTGCPRGASTSVGSDLRGLYDIFPNSGGVLSALMAQKGLKGPTNSLEGKETLFGTFFEGKYNRNVLIRDIGKRFEGADIGYKPWPCCGSISCSIDGAIWLVKKYNINPKEIEGITVYVGDFAWRNCEPLEERRKPKTVADAKFSVPFILAVAAARRMVVLSDFTTESIREPVALELAQRIIPKLDAQLNVTHGFPPSVVEIKTKGGTAYSKRVDIPYGDPRNPMTIDDIVRKFKDCASYSIKPLAKENIGRTVEMVSRLEELDDVSQIIRLLG